MRRIFAAFVVLLLVVPAAGCSITPETPREKLLAAESAYQAALQSVPQIVATGQLDAADKSRLRLAITAARASLDAWHRSPDLNDSGAAALAALRALQQILTQLQGAPT